MHVTLLLAALLSATSIAPLLTRAMKLPDQARLDTPDATAPQSLRLSLNLRNAAGLDALIAAQRNPSSPDYRRWLTPAEFGERFGQSAADYQHLVEVLTAAGLEVKTFHNRMYVEAEGTVGGMERLLGVHFLDVTTADGKRFRSYKGTPQLPADVARLVLSAGGLDTRQVFHHRLATANGLTFGPQDLRRYYDIDALHALGYGGQLSKVALIGAIPDAADQVVLAQVQYFYSAVSDSSAIPSLDVLGSTSGGDPEPGINVELQMDMEMPTVAAPLLQTVTMVEAPADMTLFTAAINEIDENLSDTTAASTSFGACEAEATFDTAATANLVAQGAVEGIAIFDAAGDSGTADCANQETGMAGSPGVDFPASVPYIIAVGGTQYNGGFNDAGAISGYGDETVWNQEMGEAVGGGGVSSLFTRPWYQFVPGMNDGGAREVPDITLLADVTPGVAIVDQAVGSIDNDGNGTSDAAPMAAGMFALINDYIGGCRLGSPAPQLYALGRAQYDGGGAAVFHDITSGNISAYGLTGPSAHIGYDEASGLGSIDVAAMAAAWPPCLPVATDAGALVDGGYTDGGSLIEWPGGALVDAGPRLAFDPCDVLACDGGTVATIVCETIPEGPAQCITTCDPTGPNTCGEGNFCFALTDGGACFPGCATTADCTALDGGTAPDGGAANVCFTCANVCVPNGNPTAAVGAACGSDSDCVTGDTCLPSMFFPGGYCTLGCGAPNVCGSGDRPTGSACLAAQEFCAATCSVRMGGPCSPGYSCNPQDTTDTGLCLPSCISSEECSFLGVQGSTCDTSIEGGVCIPPGVTPPTLTSSTASSSSSGSSHGSTAGSSSSGHVATSTASSTSSSGSSATSTSTSSGSSGTSTSTSASSTAGATSAAATTGSTGSASSAGAKKSGCGCGAGAGFDASWALFALLGGALSRRKRFARS